MADVYNTEIVRLWAWVNNTWNSQKARYLARRITTKK